MLWKIRPFEEFIERGEGRPVWVITGTIESDAFVITVHGHAVRLRTESTAADDRGAYAMVEVGDFALPDHFRVQLYQEDEDADGLALHVFRDVEAQAKASEILRQQGYDPEGAHILVHPEQSHWIYFTLDGQREASHAPRARDEGARRPTN